MKHRHLISLRRVLPIILLLAAALLSNCSVPSPPSRSASAPPPYDEQIHLDGLKRGAAMGHNPIIVLMTERGTIGIAPGSVFSEGASGFAVQNNDLVINAGIQPVTIAGISVAKGEAVLIKGGKGRKIATRFGGAP